MNLMYKMTETYLYPIVTQWIRKWTVLYSDWL